ncbi:glutamate transport system permease protein [Sinomonas atrocyanea]|jgi:glutamate transport system permease protein|uniref:amino acid ABC transporter permease n=1 Tax=Sinomonas atrocyanea TaxID=37927 RepID=UPI00277E7BAD|nr:amino acid ABC transporter permease [Sinomonas atrocyanea]MDP9885757.1 glutamate transport system permease protein [Sinomonas atrocyanea]
MSSVLYDAPGPKARTRHLVLGIVGTLVILAILGFIVWRFAQTGQFSAAKWKIFTFPLVQQTILNAIGATLSAFAVAAVGSLVLGMALAIGRLSDRPWVSRPFHWFTELFRAIPVLILMMMIYYGLPPLFGVNWPPFVAVAIALILYNGSVLAEVFRAGIEALPKGQREAGYAIGLRKSQVMQSILLPQAVRSMLPVIISQLVVTLKDTALGFIVTYNEILFQAKYFGSQAQYGSPIVPAAIVAGVLYVGMCLILSGLAKFAESRLRRSQRVSGARKGTAMAAAQDAAAQI